MKPRANPLEKTDTDLGPDEPGYAAWKMAKIERGLAESRERTAMIPVEQVWRDLKLER